MNKDDNNRNMIFFLSAGRGRLAADQDFVLSAQQDKQHAAQAGSAPHRHRCMDRVCA